MTTLTMTKFILKELEPKHDSSTKMKPYNSWNMKNSENEQQLPTGKSS